MSKGRRSGGGAARRAADDPAIVDLLETVREVRTNLAIDLSAAAGALEENQTAVARDILAATADELAIVNSEGHKNAAAAVRRRSRRTRALLALPAVPLVGALAMTTAAALSGNSKPAHRSVTSPPVPASVSMSTSVPTSTPVQHTAASSALRRLQEVVDEHAKAASVIGAADDLHKQLTRMIASTNNPAQLHVVQQLLQLEQHVLEGSRVPGTQLALAASRAIAQLLENRPSHSPSKHALSSPRTASPSAPAKPTAKPTSTHVQRAPQPHHSASTAHTSPSPRPTNPLFGGGIFNWQ